jgi:hypothetical protein
LEKARNNLIFFVGDLLHGFRGTVNDNCSNPSQKWVGAALSLLTALRKEEKHQNQDKNENGDD